MEDSITKETGEKSNFISNSIGHVLKTVAMHTDMMAFGAALKEGGGATGAVFPGPRLSSDPKGSPKLYL